MISLLRNEMMVLYSLYSPEISSDFNHVSGNLFLKLKRNVRVLAILSTFCHPYVPEFSSGCVAVKGRT